MVTDAMLFSATRLVYFRRSLKRRFPEKSMVSIDIAIESVLDEMKPSKNRTRLNQLVIARLSSGRSRAG